ncbi:MAG: SUMF1/EgtB/PvdO family nonheme iron enzyme [Planctomycetes bacterium]|nr:SUMF1/EgtB/PvdO family nonheme iron enzyme [Planctomycetota bacterium]
MTDSRRSRDSHPELPAELIGALADLRNRGLPIAERELELAAIERRFPGHDRAVRRAFEGMLQGAVREARDDDTGLPEQVGPYRILEQLGAGGMGVVYVAEQRSPVRRRVALKVVKRGMATREVLARFALERRALAAMDHRCIAKVFDAGETERGEPYFVMELVQGLPITTYCDKHRLTIPERLKLFQQVCAGVQHAHQRGVIHRDLKPGNVLVARDGDEHLPKILDFGLAKATNQDFLEATVYTEQDRILGTPEYMAPEQAAGDGEVVDLRADVYSLGVMLYELLTAELPFSTQELRRAGALEALRWIREKDPPKPSTKLLSQPDAATDCAQKRRSSLAALSRALKGDLDWIAMRAMAKEPERRYDSANALAVDLQRHLDHEPVLAGPPSPAYRLKKALRRYRVQVLGAAAVVLTAVLGAVVAVGYARDAEARTEEFNQLSAAVLLERVQKMLSDPPPALPEHLADYERCPHDLARLTRLLPDIDRTLEQLRARSPKQPDGTRAFAAEHDQFLYETLSRVAGQAPRIAKSPAFARLRDVDLRWVRYLDALSEDADYLREWSRAAQDIARSPHYAEHPIPDLKPQTGLWPIGANPVTHLWEFYHLRSAWDDMSEPASIVLPRHDAEGRITVAANTGIVFALIPGGTIWMGAQADAEAERGYDPNAQRDEQPVHRITLAPFLLARHELTKGQWRRLVFGDLPAAPFYTGDEPTHPAEGISWDHSMRLLGREGLTLPTEAQWEYACRAGTTTPWWTGAEAPSLAGAANLGDSPFAVDALRANPWGLFHVHGNVWEWCRDWLDDHAIPKRPADGLSTSPGSADRVVRGGGLVSDARDARSSFRDGFHPATAAASWAAAPRGSSTSDSAEGGPAAAATHVVGQAVGQADSAGPGRYTSAR